MKKRRSTTRPGIRAIWTFSLVLCSMLFMHVFTYNASACEPDCGPCMHWDRDEGENGECVLNTGATCSQDSECGTCGACGGSPCVCSADELLCDSDPGCETCNTDGPDVFDCEDDDTLCDSYDCYDCIAGVCEDRCVAPNDPLCDTVDDQCVECLGNSDCTVDPNRTCDTDYGQCVECVEDSDCGTAEICIDKKCWQTCSNTGECQTGEVCVGGICTTPCSDDSECSGDMICGGSGVCVQPCDGESDCGTGQVCSGGVCTNPCTGDGNCASGQVCSGSGTCTDGCSDDSECASNQVCSNGQCTDTCSSTGDCSGAEVCFGGTCEDPCSGDSDCGGGQTCSGGQCQQGCQDSSECPNGECVGGVCQDSCTDNSQCGDCEECTNGTCQAPDTTTCGDCESWDNASCSCQSYCTTGQICDEGVCKDTCGGGATCMSCQTCTNGVCEDNCSNCQTCVNNVCEDDCMDCQRCENETCVDDCPGCQDCVSDVCVDNNNNCTADDCEICDDGTCRDRCPDDNMVCDSTGVCVECMLDNDCVDNPSGPVCSPPTKTCKKECELGVFEEDVYVKWVTGGDINVSVNIDTSMRVTPKCTSTTFLSSAEAVPGATLLGTYNGVGTYDFGSGPEDVKISWWCPILQGDNKHEDDSKVSYTLHITDNEALFASDSSQEYGWDGFTNSDVPGKAMKAEVNGTEPVKFKILGDIQTYNFDYDETVLDLTPDSANSASTSVSIKSLGGTELDDPINVNAKVDQSQDVSATMKVYVYEEVDSKTVKIFRVRNSGDDVQVNSGPVQSETDVCVSSGLNGILESHRHENDNYNAQDDVLTAGTDKQCDSTANNKQIEPPLPGTATEIQNYINEVFAQSVAGIFSVTIDPIVYGAPYDWNGDGGLTYATVDQFINSAEQTLIEACVTGTKGDYNVYLVGNVVVSQGETLHAGWAEKLGDSLFIRLPSNHTYAHELGHAFGNLDDLDRTVSEQNNCATAAQDADNMMSYCGLKDDDTKLRAEQWNTIQENH